MAYTTEEKIQTLISPSDLTDALDDDRDGSADDGLLDAIIAMASNAVDAFLSGLYTVPFPDPAPTVVQEAALVFSCEAVWARRLNADQKNPFLARANYWRDRLQKIGNDELPLDAATDKPNTPGAVITESVDVDETLR
jgi:phage gp36-like protein